MPRPGSSWGGGLDRVVHADHRASIREPCPFPTLPNRVSSRSQALPRYRPPIVAAGLTTRQLRHPIFRSCTVAPMTAPVVAGLLLSQRIAAQPSAGAWVAASAALVGVALAVGRNWSSLFGIATKPPRPVLRSGSG